MIGAAGLPMAKVPTTPAASTPAHPHAEAATAPAEPAGAQGTHAGAHRSDTDATHDRHAAGDAHAADGARHAKPDANTPGARRAGHATRQPRDTRDEVDARQDADSFARLLAPEGSDKAPPTDTPQAAATPVATTPAPPPAATLPDQLLGLLASLAPAAGAATTPANAAGAPTATGPAGDALPPAGNGPPATPALQAAPAANAPSAPAALPAHARAAERSGTEALGALLPAQGREGAAPFAAVTAAHAEPAASPASAPHAGTGIDAPAAPTFDALLHATPTPPAVVTDGSRAVASAPAPLAQPADPRNGYGDEFGGNVVWMAEQRLGHAQLHVSPDHLGPIEVRLQLDGTQVQASFLSAQPDVRHALEASLPRLRELLGQHGLQLAQADVGERQSDPRGLPAQRRDANGRDPVDQALAPASPIRMRVVRGLLDEYA